jgi:hypothetical protein
MWQPAPAGAIPMTESPSLLTALRRQAAADPEAPFLFWPEGWHWRWWSWRQVAELSARWSAPLADLPAAAGVAFAADAWPQAIALDFAAQAAGLTPVPMILGGAGDGGPADSGGAGAGGPAGAGRAEYLAWIEGTGVAQEVRVTRLPDREALPRGTAPGAFGAGRTPERRDAPEGSAAPETLGAGRTPARRDAPGGSAAPASFGASVEAGVAVTDGAGRWRRLSQAELMAAAERVEIAIGAPPGQRRLPRRREVLVAGWPLHEWPARLLAAWATASGAALVLEADAARRPGTVLWARPTVFYGSAAELALLRGQVEPARKPRRFGRSRPPLPLGRLRTLFQAAPPEPAEAAFWQERGARLLQLPAMPPALPDEGTSRGADARAPAP